MDPFERESEIKKVKCTKDKNCARIVLLRTLAHSISSGRFLVRFLAICTSVRWPNFTYTWLEMFIAILLFHIFGLPLIIKKAKTDFPKCIAMPRDMCNGKCGEKMSLQYLLMRGCLIETGISKSQVKGAK